MRDKYYQILAFIFIFVWMEFGAAVLNIYCMDVKAYDKKKIIFEPISPVAKEIKVIEEILDEATKENDSVDPLTDYMQYYIFKPGVFDDEKEVQNRKEKKDEVLKKVKKIDATNMDEKEMLYKIVWKESRNQGLDGMRRVCDVVLNRVDDPRFPNNIKDVLLAPDQFTTANKLYSVVYDEETVKAVNMELSVSKEDRLDNVSIYFGRKAHTKDNYKYGDHYFSH